MKKYMLGLAIAIVFVVYTFVLRNQHSRPVVAPASLSQNNNSTTTGANSSTNSTETNSSTTSTQTSTTPPVAQYKDGTFRGSVNNAFYGNVQVSATISSGKITAVDFLQYPDENPNSISVNTAAMPYLKQEAIKSQNSNVSIVTGATFTSQAFIQSLANALSQAKQG